MAVTYLTSPLLMMRGLHLWQLYDFAQCHLGDFSRLSCPLEDAIAAADPSWNEAARITGESSLRQLIRIA